MVEAILAGLIGYVIGSVSFGRLVARFVAPGEDITLTEIPDEEGRVMLMTGTGATAVAFRAGPRWGCATALLDIAKGAAAVLIAQALWPDRSVYLVAGAAVVWGHVLPVFHKFVGGKGMSPYLGGLLFIDWLAVPVTAGAGMFTGLALGDVLLAYGSGPLFLIGWFAWRADLAHVGYAVAVNAIYWWSIRGEIRQLRAQRKASGLSIAQRRAELFSSLRKGGPWTEREL